MTCRADSVLVDELGKLTYDTRMIMQGASCTIAARVHVWQIAVARGPSPRLDNRRLGLTAA